ncbi:DUF2309 domain-containing protein [Legionella bononiensis]|uniref:Probable inorganic carbon transporter subunit DabA n=1 Tax=Legionella bononiensis TaxID=2793102 RepID=A0ABS1WAQ5_9GAMM|nr:DUF2309 domain-containing protein [Legionella bononiensis]MBL7480354.1 DUF2309 domain-containing protein [Legionella bononiensis]MBL7526414.1 DUF2309 domain-containing protein [Legionella bononiensis]MBL7563092.1 DUF2309 domain-containing protein [Legionella bononiensis]
MTTAKILSKQDRDNNAIKKSEMVYYPAKNKDLELQALVHNAAKCIAPVWPLETFIACNPLQGFEAQSFEEALAQGAFRRQRAERNLQLEEVNLQMIKWCGGFFDAGQGSIYMPNREKGFYFGFLKLAYFDKQLHHNKKQAKEFLQQLPESAEEALKMCLQILHVPQGQEEAFLSQTLRYLPGWAGFVKWKTDWQNSKKPEETQVTLTDFLAVRLVLTCILWPDAAKEKKSIDDGSLVKKVLTKLKSNEDSYRQKLLSLLLPEVKKGEDHLPRRNAQLVFCIDVRSEPFRRAIESLGSYETFGFAGFFGLPVRIDEFDTNKNKECCPVLLKPKYAIKEMSAAANNDDFERYQRGKAFINRCKSLYTQLKNNVSTPFALVESLGLWCGLNMILKSLSPELSHHSVSAITGWLKPAIPTKVAYELSETDAEQGLSLHEQISYAETVLRLMGLTSGFAKLIILCGHGSTTENNPYASALDCGACGGNHGGINARLLASILNKPEVRRGLEDCGMHIPLDTVFYGAQHNTTTDSVELYTQDVAKPIYPELISQLQNDLKEARLITNQERRVQLQSCSSHKDITRRSMDWSETRPEWGLARNAAFIVAPRHLTKNISLDGRCFLHSYRYEQDSEGTFLETILTAPMVVAEWINTQYLFSTLDNVAFGSGSKITHNVVGTIGVMQGNGSDLMHGLPLQSVMSSDMEPYHEPQRLLTLVYAPKEMVSQVIEKHSILKTLFFNQWVHLIVIDPKNQGVYQLTQSGEWILVE